MDDPSGQIRFLADPDVAGSALAAAVALGVVQEHGGVADCVAAPLADAVSAALADGIRFLVAVGNDASFRMLVQSIVDAGFTGGEVTVFLIPVTPDCDLIRTFGLPPEPARAALHLLGENHYDMDLVRVTAVGDDGKEATAVFAQVSEAGFGATLARGAAGRQGARQRLGRFLAYWRAVLTTRPRDVSLQIDKKTWSGRVTGVVVGNCSFFHDGVRVSPRSFPGDGVIDILAWRGPRSDAITLLPKMYRGEHLPHPGIEEFRAKIGLSISGTPMPVHADGLLIGRTPARYVVMPAAVRLKL